MGKKYEKLMEDMEAELNGSQKKEPEVQPDPQPEPDPAPEPDTEPDPEPDTDNRPDDDRQEPETEPEGAADRQEPQQRDIPDDPIKRAEFAFRRQLNKKDERHAKELAERDAKLAEMQKQIDEMKKAMAPKEPELKREDFEDDEDFINALTDKRVKAVLAERDEDMRRQESERAEKARQAEAEQEELREKQDAWLSNVDEAFGHDVQRSRKFLSQVAYANKNGLGQVLDSCPVASDYLLNDPFGPVVFEKLLNDKNTFMRVFDPKRPNPLAVYRELRNVEDEIIAERKAASQQADPAPAPATSVHLGKPGRQAGGMAVTNTDMFSDPKAVKKWLRENR